MFSRIRSRVGWELRKLRLQIEAVSSQALEPEEKPASPERGHVLFFAPDAAITPHFAATALVAKTLEDLGHSVLYARCIGLFARCPVMDNFVESHTLTPKRKEQNCVRCLEASIRGAKKLHLTTLDLRLFHTSEVREEVHAALGGLGQEYGKFEYEGIPFGQLAIMNLALATKHLDFNDISPAVRGRWRDYIESALTSFLVTRTILGKIPVHSIVHYGDYSIYLGVRLAAREKSIPDYTVCHPAHRGIDRTRIMIAPQIWAYSYHARLPPWADWRELPLPPAVVREIGEDLKLRLLSTGSHVYSPAKTVEANLHARLGIPESAKLVVAYTSSLDEVYSSKAALTALKLRVRDGENAFPDQTSWLEALLDWIERHPDRHLVVRVHPREGSNKREKTESQHLGILRKRFTLLPPRVHFVWPENPISSYDLAESADVITTSWSSVGCELARLGIPALAAMGARSIYPDDDFLHAEKSSEAYFKRLEELFEREASLDRIARAFRCYYVYHLGSTVDYSDVVPSYDFMEVPEFRRPREGKMLEEMIVHGRDVFQQRFDQLKSPEPDALAREREALVETLGALVQFIATGVWGRDRAFDASGSFIESYSQGKRLRRFSPLCARLVRALAAERDSSRRALSGAL